jgi:hypothetical protein
MTDLNEIQTFGITTGNNDFDVKIAFTILDSLYE